MNTEIAAYTPTKAALADLASRYKGLVFEVTTPKGMVEAAERKEREAAEAKAKAERDAKEAIEREAKRKEAEEADAAGMWALFKTRYGHLPQYYDAIVAFDLACTERV